MVSSPHPSPLPRGPRGEGELCSPQRTVQTSRLSTPTSDVGFPLSLGERVRVRGNGASGPLAYRIIPCPFFEDLCPSRTCAKGGRSVSCCHIFLDARHGWSR